MEMMIKKIISIVVLVLIVTSCSTKTGKVGRVNSEDISYFKDNRTGLCYAIIGAKQGNNWFDESTSIGMTCVPCNDKVIKLLNK